MKKVKKTWERIDTIHLFLLGFIFLGIILCIMWGKDGKLFGSTTDWPTQHVIIPEYFRALFLETKDFFPDFAFQIGSGQNIYNLAYYGLLNPVITLSYFLPIQNMYTYITISTCFLILSSVWLFYKFLKNHQFSSTNALISSIIFMCSSCLIYHIHRHIMFVNYMPFLILGFMGVDRYFEKKKSWLLILSTFLMILMSYYYSVVGIIVLVLYGIYQYLTRNEKITLKNFLWDGIKAVCPIIVGILLSGILILPTFLVILNGRGALNVQPSLLELFLPFFHLNYVLYNAYGVGLGAIAIFAIVPLFFQEKQNKFLGIVLSSIILFPFLNYLFNATMYIDAKALIPFTPLYAFSIALFIQGLEEKKIKLLPSILIAGIILLLGVPTISSKVLLLLFDTFLIFLGILMIDKTNLKLLGKSLFVISAITITVLISRRDDFVNKESYFGETYRSEQSLVENLTKEDQDIYRISNQIYPSRNPNQTFGNIGYYTSTIYSSIYHKEYNQFYYDVMNNAVQSRNAVITSAIKNYPFLLLTGNKYLLTNTPPFIGYEKINQQGKQALYETKNALPLAYASSHLVSQKTFEEMGYPYNQDIILKNIIVDKDIDNPVSSNVHKIDLKLDLEELKKLNIKETNGVYSFSLDKQEKITLPLKEPLSNTLLYIRFQLLESNSCNIGDTEITINNVGNKLTCASWKYHNQNYTFDYVLALDEIDSLEITLSKGNYKLTNIEFYTLDYNTIEDLNENVDPFLFDSKKTMGDRIVGDIAVQEDGYFVLSVPYDTGFQITVDGKKQDYEKANISFIGFPISQGNHHIEIEYQAPGKKGGAILSLLGMILAIAIIIYENKKKENA